MKTAAVTLALVLGSFAAAQDPAEAATPPAPAAAAAPAFAGDPLALPFQKDMGPETLHAWVVAYKSEGVRRIREARSFGDRAEVSRIILRLEQARLHALAEIRRLRGPVPPPAPAPPPSAEMLPGIG